MKKHLLTFAAALAVGVLSFSAAAEDGKVHSGQYGDMNYLFNGYWTYSGSETFYPASLFETATNGLDEYTIESLKFQMDSDCPTDYMAQFDIYLAKTTSSSWTPSTPTEFTKVYSNVVNFADANFGKTITFPLDEYFVMEKGEGLIVGIQSTRLSGDVAFTFATASAGAGHIYYYADGESAQEFGTFTTSNSDYIVGLSIDYQAGAVEKPGVGGGGEEKPVETGTVHKGQYGDMNYLFNGYWMYSGSETFYPASLFETATNGLDEYTIESLKFQMDNDCPTDYMAQFDIYLAKTTSSSWTPSTPTEFTKVYSNVVNFADANFGKTITFPLDEYFVMEKGEGLIVGIQSTRLSGDVAFTFATASAGAGHIYYYADGESAQEFGTFTTSNSDYIVGLSIDYQAGAVEKPGVGGGEEKPVQTETVHKGQYGDMNYLFNGYWTYSGSETFYPASLFETATKGLDKYTIETLKFEMDNECPTDYSAQFDIYLAKTTSSSWTPSTPTEFTKVYSNVVNFADANFGKTITFPLDEYFVMEKGEGLIVGIQSTRLSGDVAFTFATASAGAGHIYYYADGESAQEFGTFTTSNSDYIVGLSIDYVEGEATKPGGGDDPTPSEVVDLAATSINGPTTNVYMGKSYEYTVGLRNTGDVAVENYTVTLWNKADASEVDKFVGTETIRPFFPYDVKFNVEFDKVGTWELYATVEVEGDNDETNNTTEVLEVSVDKLAYKAVSLTGNEAPEVGSTETYKATVANEGLSALTDYTVSFYLVREGVDDLLLETKTENPEIGVGATAEVEFSYTFNMAGKYDFKAVVVKGEGDPSETPVLAVNVELEGLLTPVLTDNFPGNGEMKLDYYGNTIQRNYNQGASQILYPASYFGDHEQAYQIQSLGFTVMESISALGVPVKIYLAQTDRTEGYASAADVIPADQFTLVYDGVFNPGKLPEGESKLVTVELQRLFSLENGKSLVINIESKGEDGTPYICLGSVTTEECYQLYTYSNRKSPDMTVYNPAEFYTVLRMYNPKFLPVLTLGYALEPLPEKVDLAATSLVVPTEDVRVDNPLGFRVNLSNQGTADVEVYSIELLSYDEAGEATVLTTVEGTRYITGGQTTRENFDYTFAEAGTYKLAARVVVEGDVDESNNTTPVVELTVSDKSGVDSVLAEGTLSYDAATKVLNVNLGACTVTVSDLAGRTVASYQLDGAAQLPLNLNAGVYVVSAAGKTVKVRI